MKYNKSIRCIIFIICFLLYGCNNDSSEDIDNTGNMLLHLKEVTINYILERDSDLNKIIEDENGDIVLLSYLGDLNSRNESTQVWNLHVTWGPDNSSRQNNYIYFINGSSLYRMQHYSYETPCIKNNQIYFDLKNSFKGDSMLDSIKKNKSIIVNEDTLLLKECNKPDLFNDE